MMYKKAFWQKFHLCVGASCVCLVPDRGLSDSEFPSCHLTLVACCHTLDTDLSSLFEATKSLFLLLRFRSHNFVNQGCCLTCACFSGHVASPLGDSVLGFSSADAFLLTPWRQLNDIPAFLLLKTWNIH